MNNKKNENKINKKPMDKIIEVINNSQTQLGDNTNIYFGKTDSGTIPKKS